MHFQRDAINKKILSSFARLIIRKAASVFVPARSFHDMDRVRLADCLRIIKAYRMSAWLCRRILKRTSDQNAKFWAQQVLATSLQYHGKYEASNEAFAQLIQTEDELKRSFSLQHFGKSLIEQRRFDEAELRIRDALILREGLDRSDLILSSRRALDGIHALKSVDSAA